MSLREIVHRLLYLALLEIRNQGRQSENQVLFDLADLYSIIPLQLEQAGRGERSYDDILTLLRYRAQQKSLAGWLERQVETERKLHIGKTEMDSSTLVHRLLSAALLILRAEAHETGNQSAFCLAHLFHNIPLDLVLVLQGKRSYDDIYHKIASWTQDTPPQARGCDTWLEQAIRETTSATDSR